MNERLLDRYIWRYLLTSLSLDLYKIKHSSKVFHTLIKHRIWCLIFWRRTFRNPSIRRAFGGYSSPPRAKNWNIWWILFDCIHYMLSVMLNRQVSSCRERWLLRNIYNKHEYWRSWVHYQSDITIPSYSNLKSILYAWDSSYWCSRCTNVSAMQQPAGTFFSRKPQCLFYIFTISTKSILFYECSSFWYTRNGFLYLFCIVSGKSPRL